MTRSARESIREKIESVLNGLGAVLGGALVIGSVLSDGALDAILAALIEALQAVGIDAEGTLVAPIAEVAVPATARLAIAGAGAVAVTNTVQPAIQASISNTPNPNVEGVDATKISDELGSGSRSAWDQVQGEKPNPVDIHITQGDRIHILDGDGLGNGGHASGTGVPGKKEFPGSWDDDKVINNVEDVAKNPDRSPILQDHDTFRVHGTRNGVDIVVIVTKDGRVVSGYPEGGDGVTVNDPNGNPLPLRPPGMH